MNTLVSPRRSTGAVEFAATDVIAALMQGLQRLGSLMRMPAPGVPEASAQLLRLAAAYETSQPSYAADLRAAASMAERETT
jgi:hypothetical protein